MRRDKMGLAMEPEMFRVKGAEPRAFATVVMGKSKTTTNTPDQQPDHKGNAHASNDEVFLFVWGGLYGIHGLVSGKIKGGL